MIVSSPERTSASAWPARANRRPFVLKLALTDFAFACAIMSYTAGFRNGSPQSYSRSVSAQGPESSRTLRNGAAPVTPRGRVKPTLTGHSAQRRLPDSAEAGPKFGHLVRAPGAFTGGPAHRLHRRARQRVASGLPRDPDHAVERAEALAVDRPMQQEPRPPRTAIRPRVRHGANAGHGSAEQGRLRSAVVLAALSLAGRPEAAAQFVQPRGRDGGGGAAVEPRGVSQQREPAPGAHDHRDHVEDTQVQRGFALADKADLARPPRTTLAANPCEAAPRQAVALPGRLPGASP